MVDILFTLPNNNRMTTPKITPAKLPFHLMPRTVGNIEVETPRYVNPSQVFLREDTGELFLYTDMPLDTATRNPSTLMGRVGIMKAIATDPELPNTQPLLMGYVADLRFISSTNKFKSAPPAERPDNDRDANIWFEDMKTLTPIAAIAFRHDHESKEISTTGDTRFAQTAIHLASLADELDKKLKRQAKISAKKSAKKATKSHKK